MSKSDFPKADNSKVLRPYSKSMRSLLNTQTYNSGPRPSEHSISEKSFAKDNGGSIAHNLFEMERIDEKREVRLPHSVLSFSNTASNDYFLRRCREEKKKPHPARMPKGLVSFFTEFLTEPGDLILDPFAGSNTTGYVAEKLKRKWVSLEINPEYAEDSILRFEEPELEAKLLINDQLHMESVNA
jgi:site-specific DNA-methyltransferase (cytosine-N4-specific)